MYDGICSDGRAGGQLIMGFEPYTLYMPRSALVKQS